MFQLQKSIQNIPFSGFAVERVLKVSAKGRVVLVREREKHTRCIYRSFSGSGEVYKKMLTLDCPYLPEIFEVVEDGGTVHVLEEYVPGDSLSFILEGAPLSQQHAKDVAMCICRALQALHGIGAVHRDIKPENIILRGSDAVLIDFDASRISNPAGSADTEVMGTTGYAAPEQYGFSQTDARADIYALGILINEMLTKQHPSRLLAEGSFGEIVRRCTQINPEHRYSSVQKLMEALDGSPKKPRRGAYAAIGLALLAAAGILFAGGLLSPEPEVEALLPQADGFGRPDMGVEVTAKEVEITMEPWEGSTEGFSTPFRCDMNGDGKPEDYVFGMSFVSTNHGAIITKDRNGMSPGETHYRDVYPCVWRLDNYLGYVEAQEFAELLTDIKVEIWRVDDFESPKPRAYASNYIWPGCVSVVYAPVRDGTWLYDISACLDGVELTARATTSFYIRE